MISSNSSNRLLSVTVFLITSLIAHIPNMQCNHVLVWDAFVFFYRKDNSVFMFSHRTVLSIQFYVFSGAAWIVCRCMQSHILVFLELVFLSWSNGGALWQYLQLWALFICNKKPNRANLVEFLRKTICCYRNCKMLCLYLLERSVSNRIISPAIQIWRTLSTRLDNDEKLVYIRDTPMRLAEVSKYRKRESKWTCSEEF